MKLNKFIDEIVYLQNVITDEDNLNKLILYIPRHIKNDDSYYNRRGRVIMIGSKAYSGEKYKESGPWCHLGDVVSFREKSELYYSKHFVYISENVLNIKFAVIPDDSVTEIFISKEIKMDYVKS